MEEDREAVRQDGLTVTAVKLRLHFLFHIVANNSMNRVKRKDNQNHQNHLCPVHQKNYPEKLRRLYRMNFR